MSCKIKYTPAEFIAIMAVGFVHGELMPSIDKDGKPTYVLQEVSKKTIRSGCAATTIIQATANAAMLNKLTSLGTHEACSISGMDNRGIQMWDIVEFPSSPLWRCAGGHSGFMTNCSYCGPTKSAVIEFFQGLQNCHDIAARWFYTATTIANLDAAKAIAAFRNIVLIELKNVAKKYGITWPEVEVGIVTLSAPLKERIPAIAEKVAA